jgi:hypothetical protein
MITTPQAAQLVYARRLRNTPAPINRGSWQSVQTDMLVRELDNVLLEFNVPATAEAWARDCNPDLPWAEHHHQERIGGKPLNPAPSYLEWPWHSEKHREQFKSQPSVPVYRDLGQGHRVITHVEQRPFDHTYPERFWPKHPHGSRHPMRGIRFDYGDLRDVISLLRREPFTRQAYLPVFFPEDTGSTVGQRIPCTLGYHFIRNGAQLDCKYFLRSCDITRHFLNDAYMAGRLLQYVILCLEGARSSFPGLPCSGKLTMFISNFHMFVNDEWRFQ